MTQQGDVRHFQTVDGGEITSTNGVVEMSGGLETFFYLSLFGGNEEDPGEDDTALSWWGNLDETEPENQYRSKTQHLLQALPATSGNLKRLEDAANSDVKSAIDIGLVKSVTVTVTIPAPNRVKFTIDINGDTTLEFEENWTAEL